MPHVTNSALLVSICGKLDSQFLMGTQGLYIKGGCNCTQTSTYIMHILCKQLVLKCLVNND